MKLDSIEVLRPLIPCQFRAVVFDFDGTLSLLREGWSRLMAEIGIDHLGDRTQLEFLEREMLLLSGQPSIHQMRRLAEIILERTGESADPEGIAPASIKKKKRTITVVEKLAVPLGVSVSELLS